MSFMSPMSQPPRFTASIQTSSVFARSSASLIMSSSGKSAFTWSFVAIDASSRCVPQANAARPPARDAYVVAGALLASFARAYGRSPPASRIARISGGSGGNRYAFPATVMASRPRCRGSPSSPGLYARDGLGALDEHEPLVDRRAVEDPREALGDDRLDADGLEARPPAARASFRTRSSCPRGSGRPRCDAPWRSRGRGPRADAGLISSAVAHV